jgi:hypothetical protein
MVKSAEGRIASLAGRWRIDAAPGGGLLPEAADPSAWDRLRGSPRDRARLEALFAEADEALASASPLPEPGFADFMRFYRDGDRITYELLYFERRRRLSLFALAALAAPSGRDGPYLRALEEVLWSICGEYSWCLPAHLPPPPRDGGGPGYALDPGGTVGTGEAPPADRFLDLFAAETGSALAEIRGLLAGRLAPEVSHRVGAEVRSRVLATVLEDGYRYFWEDTPNNWAAVCAGGAGVAALWLLEEPAELARALARLCPPLDHYLAGFPEDGACLEGMAYWTYGFSFFVAFAELLRERSGGAADILGDAALSGRLGAIARFPQRSCLVGGVGLGFSDSLSPFRYPRGILSRLAGRLPGVLLPDASLAEELRYDHCRRWVKQLRDFVWLEPDAPMLDAADGAAAGGAIWFPQAQWAVARAPASTPPAAFAAKGGHNDEPHNHDDVGSFILAVGDEAYLDDFGAGRYSRGYFGPERYSHFVASSFGHSLPILDGRGQSEGPDRRCSETLFEERATSLRLELEISGAYASADLVSLRRRFEVELAAGPRLALADSFRFAGAARRELRERFVTLLPARASGGAAVVEGRAGALAIRPASAATRVELSAREFEAHQGPPKTATIVDFVFETVEASFEAAFDLSFVPRR